MDLTLNDEQQAISDLAGKILGDLCNADALRAHEQGDAPTLDAAWQALAVADLLGISLPESAGGGGYGILEAALVAEQVGRHVAPVPYSPTVAAAHVLAAHGGADHLAGVADGSTILTVALSEGGTEISPSIPETTAERDGDGWRIDGTKHFVPWGAQAARVLVPARSADGVTDVFVVDPAAAGVTVTEESAMWGLPQATLEMAGTPGTPLGADAFGTLVDASTALVCATSVGVCEGAIRITAAYVSEREQFGSKIGTFQAVAHRLADAYIDTQGVRLTSLQAAWRLSNGLPAADELDIAKFWAAEAGHRVVHAAQHLHGGIGMDLDSPIHRYFRWAKVLELHTGSATERLLALGARMAAS